MLGKKLNKPYDRMGYKLATIPMVMGGKMNHKPQSHQIPQMQEPMKPIHSDLERPHHHH
jgi:hypothetical protein